MQDPDILSHLETKKDYAELFLSELCDYFDRKKYEYRVIYRSWVNEPGVSIKYDNGKKSTTCDLAIFVLVENKRLNIFFNFKVGLYEYKVDYKLKALIRQSKNGVRHRDKDYAVALKTTKDDNKAIYCFVIRNKLEDAEDNRYKTRIISCDIKNKSIAVGAAIRNILDN